MVTPTMKKGLAGALCLLLVLAAGCEKLANPFGPDTNQGLGTGAGNLPVTAGITPALAAELVDDDATQAGIQATVVVAFADYMDAASFPSGVKVINTSTGAEVASLDISYNADARLLYIRHADWTRTSAFLVKLVSGTVKNRWGTALDGNGNGTAEGSPYDDYLSTFYTSGSAPDSCVGTTAPTVAALAPDTVRITDTLPQIAVTFNGALDTVGLVAANFQLTSASGSSVPLTRTAMNPGYVAFQPSAPLRFGDLYRLVIVHGNLAADARANTPDYLLRLDTDDDGPEASEPALESYFLCDTVAPPTVGTNPIANGRRFSFSTLMDEGTLTAANVRVYDSDGYVPGTFVLSPGNQGNSTILDYYFSRETSGLLRCFVAKTVESLKDRMLDGQDNPNGIGGEPWDDYWSN